MPWTAPPHYPNNFAAGGNTQNIATALSGASLTATRSSSTTNTVTGLVTTVTVTLNGNNQQVPSVANLVASNAFVPGTFKLAGTFGTCAEALLNTVVDGQYCLGATAAATTCTALPASATPACTVAPESGILNIAPYDTFFAHFQVFKVDGVLIPNVNTLSIPSVIAAQPSTQIFQQIVQAAGFTNMLNNVQGVTVFVPLDNVRGLMLMLPALLAHALLTW